MTDRLNNGSIILPCERGSAVLTFSTEGEEMVIGLHAPGLGYSEVRIDIERGKDLRQRYGETLANAMVAKNTRVQAEKDEAREREAESRRAYPAAPHLPS